jgi:uncharacterized membrane protein YedE/YeeE
MPVLLALVAGLVFGAGLTISQMVDPAKVLGFLDFAGMFRGTWDPSLAFVMGGALAVSAPAYFVAQRRGRAVLGPLRIPVRRRLDKRLTVGAVVFGIGWGLVGFCPGPAVTALGFGAGKAIVFVAAMLGGMAIYEAIAAPRGAGVSPADQAA